MILKLKQANPDVVYVEAFPRFVDFLYEASLRVRTAAA